MTCQCAETSWCTLLLIDNPHYGLACGLFIINPHCREKSVLTSSCGQGVKSQITPVDHTLKYDLALQRRLAPSCASSLTVSGPAVQKSSQGSS